MLVDALNDKIDATPPDLPAHKGQRARPAQRVPTAATAGARFDKRGYGAARSTVTR